MKRKAKFRAPSTLVKKENKHLNRLKKTSSQLQVVTELVDYIDHESSCICGIEVLFNSDRRSLFSVEVVSKSLDAYVLCEDTIAKFLDSLVLESTYPRFLTMLSLRSSIIEKCVETQKLIYPTKLEPKSAIIDKIFKKQSPIIKLKIREKTNRIEKDKHLIYYTYKGRKKGMRPSGVVKKRAFYQQALEVENKKFGCQSYEDMRKGLFEISKQCKDRIKIAQISSDTLRNIHKKKFINSQTSLRKASSKNKGIQYAVPMLMKSSSLLEKVAINSQRKPNLIIKTDRKNETKREELSQLKTFHTEASVVRRETSRTSQSKKEIREFSIAKHNDSIQVDEHTPRPKKRSQNYILKKKERLREVGSFTARLKKKKEDIRVCLRLKYQREDRPRLNLKNLSCMKLEREVSTHKLTRVYNSKSTRSISAIYKQ